MRIFARYCLKSGRSFCELSEDNLNTNTKLGYQMIKQLLNSVIWVMSISQFL